MSIPRVYAREIDTKPDTNPLMQVICIGFLVEMFRVRLLSMPQHIMERVTNKGPRKLNLPWLESHVKNTPAAVMHINASHNLFPAFSLKKITAITAVKIPSRFSSNEVVKPEIWLNPNIKHIGAIIPPESTAPNSQGKSPLFRLALLMFSVETIPLLIEYTESPANAPK
jgi:hypothetical protein